MDVFFVSSFVEDDAVLKSREAGGRAEEKYISMYETVSSANGLF